MTMKTGLILVCLLSMLTAYTESLERKVCFGKFAKLVCPTNSTLAVDMLRSAFIIGGCGEGIGHRSCIQNLPRGHSLLKVLQQKCNGNRVCSQILIPYVENICGHGNEVTIMYRCVGPHNRGNNTNSTTDQSASTRGGQTSSAVPKGLTLILSIVFGSLLFLLIVTVVVFVCVKHRSSSCTCCHLPSPKCTSCSCLSKLKEITKNCQIGKLTKTSSKTKINRGSVGKDDIVIVGLPFYDNKVYQNKRNSMGSDSTIQISMAPSAVEKGISLPNKETKKQNFLRIPDLLQKKGNTNSLPVQTRGNTNSMPVQTMPSEDYLEPRMSLPPTESCDWSVQESNDYDYELEWSENEFSDDDAMTDDDYENADFSPKPTKRQTNNNKSEDDYANCEFKKKVQRISTRGNKKRAPPIIAAKPGIQAKPSKFPKPAVPGQKPPKPACKPKPRRRPSDLDVPQNLQFVVPEGSYVSPMRPNDGIILFQKPDKFNQQSDA